MNAHFLLGPIVIMCAISSCGSIRENPNAIVDYDRMMFSDGECTTLLSRYDMHDAMLTDSVGEGYCVLRGNCFVRSALSEMYENGKVEKIRIPDNCFDWPHLIIPSINLNLQITDTPYRVIIPSGTYELIVVSEEYYPIYLKRTFKSRHIYDIDFYLGCTVIH